jgi:hypothetical protein
MFRRVLSNPYMICIGQLIDYLSASKFQTNKEMLSVDPIFDAFLFLAPHDISVLNIDITATLGPGRPRLLRPVHSD